jgi:plastocyanin
MSFSRRLAVFTVALIGLAACAAMAASTAVQMTDSDAFVPKEVSIKTGDTVVWKNVSSKVHTVTDDATLAAVAEHVTIPAGVKPFNSGRIQPGDEYSYKFTTPGTYKYVCVPHEDHGMVGTVVVK